MDFLLKCSTFSTAEWHDSVNWSTASATLLATSTTLERQRVGRNAANRFSTPQRKHFNSPYFLLRETLSPHGMSWQREKSFVVESTVTANKYFSSVKFGGKGFLHADRSWRKIRSLSVARCFLREPEKENAESGGGDVSEDFPYRFSVKLFRYRKIGISVTSTGKLDWIFIDFWLHCLVSWGFRGTVLRAPRNPLESPDEIFSSHLFPLAWISRAFHTFSPQS